MLDYFTRILLAVAREWRHDSGALTCTTHHRVRLRHVDFNQHMNQAAYAAVCEEARIPWLFRSGAWRQWRAAGINPVVGQQSITYRRELKPLQGFRIDTRAVRMDGRLLVLEQHLIAGKNVHARNRLSLLLVGEAGVLSAEDATQVCQAFLTTPLKVHAWTIED